MHPSDSGGVSRKHGCSVILRAFPGDIFNVLWCLLFRILGLTRPVREATASAWFLRVTSLQEPRAQFYCLWNRRFIHSSCSFADLCFQCEDQGLLLTLRSPRLGTYQPLELLGPKKTPFLQIPKAEKTNGSLWYLLAYKSPCWPPGSFSIISTCYNFQNP